MQKHDLSSSEQPTENKDNAEEDMLLDSIDQANPFTQGGKTGSGESSSNEETGKNVAMVDQEPTELENPEIDAESEPDSSDESGAEDTSEDESSESEDSSDETSDSDYDSDSSDESDSDSGKNQYNNKSFKDETTFDSVFKGELDKQKEQSLETGGKNRNDDLDEEISLLKMASETPDELYQLIITDPEYYLGIIENYKQENLGNLFNCLITRKDGRLLVKFKVYPEDRWTELGYFNDTYNDQETYEEFCNHVRIQLQKPRRARPKPGEKLTVDEILAQGDGRNHLDYELGDKNDIQNDSYVSDKKNAAHPGTNEGNGDDVDLEKLRSQRQEQMLPTNLFPPKRPRERNQEPQQGPPPSAGMQQQQPSNIQLQITDQPTIPSVPQVSGSSGQHAAPSGRHADMLLRGYLKQILSQIATNIPAWLGINQVQSLPANLLGNSQTTVVTKYPRFLQQLRENYQKCPVYLRPEYLKLMESLEQPINTEFLGVLSNLESSVPKELRPQFQDLMCKAITSRPSGNVYQRLFAPDFTHERICQRLGLGLEDQSILKSHGIDLLETWNSYVNSRV